jgi:anti-repressor protein
MQCRCEITKDTMNEIKIFENEKFGKVRTAGTSSNPLFCLADVCRVLELQTSAVMRRLDDGVITSHSIQDNLGRTQQANFVNEDGLYDVILNSRKPEARAFRKWITSEVLPSIRKTGQYNVFQIPKTFAEALRLAAEQQEQIEV